MCYQTRTSLRAVDSTAAFAAQGFFSHGRVHRLMLLFDGLGAALFAIEAVAKVWGLDFGRPLAPILLGVVTAIGGGLIRDVLAGRPTLLMSREIYAIPVALGCTLFVVILEIMPEAHVVASIAVVALIFAIRVAALRWNLTVPVWLLTGSRRESDTQAP